MAAMACYASVPDGMSQIGELLLEGARGDAPVRAIDMEPSDRWVPEELTGPPLNVAQLLRRLGEAIRESVPAEPDFNVAVRRHQLLVDIERASQEARQVRATR